MKKLVAVFLLAWLGYELFFADSTEFNQAISLEQTSLYQGNLILVNKDTPLQEDPRNLVPIPHDLAQNIRVDDDYLLDAQALKSLYALFGAAQQDGIEYFTINSCLLLHI